MKLVLVLALVVACGAGGTKRGMTTVSVPATQAERALALLPDGAQIVVEIDLGRLRANSVVGPVTTDALGRAGADTKLPGLPMQVSGSPLANSDLIVLAAYGVGTAQAATLTLLATKSDVPGAIKLDDEFVVLGPEEWTRQVEARSAIAAQTPLVASADLLALRGHAMPKGAPGAVLQVTAQLGFDARVALARQLGIDLAPARLSAWADVADDFAFVIDADAADPGDKVAKSAIARMRKGLGKLLAAAAVEPALRILGVTSSLEEARFVEQGTWVRAIVAIGPRHLARIVERARAMLGS
jgi:hypothetical protein